MREPYKYINDKIRGYTILEIPADLEQLAMTGSDLKEAIEQAQKEAYNQAIQDSADTCFMNDYCELITDEDSILKLKIK